MSCQLAKRSSINLLGLTVLAACFGMSLPACVRVQHSSEGERCAEDLPCKKGLRCSFKKKRCFKPVDCDLLGKRLNSCTRELMEAFSPEAKSLAEKERAKLIPRIQEHLRRDAVEHCKFDASEHKRQKRTKPPMEKSWGEDAKGETLSGCLAKAACSDFAACFLVAAGVMTDRTKDPGYHPVFPLKLARPAAQPRDAAEGAPSVPSEPRADALLEEGRVMDAPRMDAPAMPPPEAPRPERGSPSKAPAEMARP